VIALVDKKKVKDVISAEKKEGFRAFTVSLRKKGQLRSELWFWLALDEQSSSARPSLSSYHRRACISIRAGSF